MKPMICECCGGLIDPTTMRCMYCCTAYERDENDRVVRIETFQNPVKVYRSEMDVEGHIASELGPSNLSQMAVKQLARNLADAIAESMDMTYEYDPINNSHRMTARIRIVEPKHLF